MKTRAAVLRRVGEPLVIEELELDPPGPGEVLVHYRASGLCHSDLHVMEGLMAHPTPVVLGHEGAGVVEGVGAGVTRVSAGDHVLTSYQPACGLCRYCTIGRPNLCELRMRPRNVMWDGSSRLEHGSVHHFFQISSHSEYAVVPEECLISVRRDAPLDVICLVSCGVATGAGAVINRARVTPGASVVVVGCGGVGLNAVQAAHLSGAAPVIAVDLHDHKLESAREFGATHTLNAADLEACATAVRDICGGEGADISIEAVGTESTMEFAFAVLRRGGRAVIAGVARDGAKIQLDPRLLLQERELTGTSFGGARQRVDLPMLVDLYMSGRFKLEELISERVKLEDINGAYDRMTRGEIKRDVLVFPW